MDKKVENSKKKETSSENKPKVDKIKRSKKKIKKKYYIRYSFC